ncbi:MAG: hypothetical protein GY810_27515 [Aureispira sp.]|nr:hypothetical protein [Aureispira sp.]
MLKKLNWTATSNEERVIAIEKIKNVIDENDGIIVNFNMFSDLALALSIEIEENRIVPLYKDLNSILNISEFDAEKTRATSTREWLIFMNISFSKGTGNFKTEIPDVPG